MKKILALALALCLVLSLGVVAFADDVSDHIVGETNQVTIPFTFELVGDTTQKDGKEVSTSIADTLKFSAELTGVAETKEGVTVDNAKTAVVVSVADVQLAAGAAGTDAGKGNVVVTIPAASAYPSIGKYTYTIIPEAGKAAGVKYFTNPITLVITVIQENGVKRVAAVHTENPANPNNKTGDFTFKYESSYLQVKKIVGGRLGDKETQYFDITVKLTAESGKDYAASYAVTGVKEGDPTTISVGTPVTFHIKHDQTITIEDLPYGVSYEVTESNLPDGYKNDSIFYVNFSKTIGSIEDIVIVTNSKDGEIDTGVVLDSLPYVLILAVVAVGAIALVSKKRFN